jgi:hypothetical protein
MAQSLLDQAMGTSQPVTAPSSASNAASAPSSPTANTGSLLDQAMASDAATTPQSGTSTAHDLTTAEYAALPKDKQTEYDQHIRAGRSIFDPAIGFVKGVGDTVNTLSGLISRVAPSVVRPQDVQNVKTAEGAKPGTLQVPGKVGEGVAEFFLGDEALKGLSIAERLGLATKVTKLAESHPMIAKIIGHGLAAVRGGAVTTGQQLAHGATPGEAATAGGIATGLGAGAGAATDIMPAIKTAINGGQSTVSEAIQDAAQTATDQAELRSAKIKATEPVRVHPPELDPAVRDHARINPFPGEDIKIKTEPGTPATETEKATNPTARITGPNGSSIELELDGKTARVKGIINSGKPGDGQRLYDNAIEWAKDSGYDTFEGDKVQTQEGKTAWQRISERHNARMGDTFPHTPSIDLTGSRPAPAAEVVAPKTPSAGIRTTIEDASNAVKAKAQGIYKQLDEASGGRWQRYDDALKNIQDKMDEVNGVDDDSYDRLETKRNDIETSQAQMIEDLKGKGIDPKAADAAVAHYKQAMALRDLDKAVKATTAGDVARVGGKETINLKPFVTRIQRLADSGRLDQALGKDGAQALLKEAYAAKTAQDIQKIVKRVLAYAGIGAAMGAGAHATHIFNHLTGEVTPIAPAVAETV